MSRFEIVRALITEQLSSGSTYVELAAALNESGNPPPKGGQWSAWSAYNAARRLGLSSIRPCKAQPRAGRTARQENLQRVTHTVRRALDTGVTTAFDLRCGSIQSTAKTLGLAAWSWRLYRHAAMRALGLQPPPIGL